MLKRHQLDLVTMLCSVISKHTMDTIQVTYILNLGTWRVQSLPIQGSFWVWAQPMRDSWWTYIASPLSKVNQCWCVYNKTIIQIIWYIIQQNFLSISWDVDSIKCPWRAVLKDPGPGANELTHWPLRNVTAVSKFSNSLYWIVAWYSMWNCHSECHSSPMRSVILEYILPNAYSK